MELLVWATTVDIAVIWLGNDDDGGIPNILGGYVEPGIGGGTAT